MKAANEPLLIHLANGLRLVHIHDKHTHTGIFGVCVRAGSGDEDINQLGLAHFVEHTIFKGTKHRNSWHIINRMESVGGELNAYTTKETTTIYSLFPSTATTRAIDLIADLVINSQFPVRELDKEREVIIDEINSYLDSPSEAIFDDFDDLAFAGSSLGHNILGTIESVKKLTSNDCRSFLNNYYHTGNIVVFYSGHIAPERISNYVERYFAGLPCHNTDIRSKIATNVRQFNTIQTHPIHQAHIVLGAETPSLLSSDRYAFSLLANILGGPGMNSLLNVELRERSGLVYNVEASTTFYSNTGLLTIYFGCDALDRERCLNKCNAIISQIADGYINHYRLNRARKQYLGQLAIASENREARIMSATRSTLFRGVASSNAETIDAINSLQPEQISSAANSILKASSLTFLPESK